MDREIDAALKAWAEWLARRQQIEGLSYPKSVLAPRKSGGRGFDRETILALAPRLFESGYATHAAVLALRRAATGGEALFDAVLVYYVGQGTVDERAKLMGVCRDTLHKRVCQAHGWIRDHLAAESVRRWPCRPTVGS